MKNIFCYFFTELKTYHPSCSIYKHDAFDTADPSIMQDACYMLYNRPCSPWSLCSSVVEQWSTESEGLRFDSSWGLRIFSLSHARDTTNTSFTSKLPSVNQALRS